MAHMEEIKITSRPYCGTSDMKAILDLVKSRPAERVMDYPSPADLEELLSVDAALANTRLWETPQGQLAGYVLLDHYEDFTSLLFEYRPGFAFAADEMLAWGVEIFEKNRQKLATQLQLSVREDAAERIRLLEAHGFAKEDWFVVQLARSLADPIEEPTLPERFSIRTLHGEDELPSWVALHRAAFGTQNMTMQERLSWMGVADYDPSLDLVAVAPNGNLAAYVFCAIYAEENALSGKKIGQTDPVATHPDYQRMGLSKALLLTGLKLLKARGMESAHMGTSGDNIAMQKAALSAGFRITERSWMYAWKFSEEIIKESGA